MLRFTAAPAIALTLACGAAHAQFHAGDIAIGLVGDRIATGVFFYVGENGVPLLSERVFICNLGKFPGFNDDPGLDSLDGTFLPGQAIGYTMRKSLRKWTGSGLTTSMSELLQTRFGPSSTTRVSSTVDTPVVGTTRTSSSFGQFHHHIGYTLLDPASDGVYVMEFELWSPSGTPETSKPYWLVINQNSDPETVQAVVAFVKQNLTGETCAPDLNADGFVDDTDFVFFAAAYNELICDLPGCPFDFDGNGTVDDADFVVFAQSYNELICP